MPYTTCFMCNRTTQCDTHHLLPGSNRRKSDKLGLVVPLCRECHNYVHANPKETQWLKAYGQEKAMREQGWDTERFIKEFGRNYIDE